MGLMDWYMRNHCKVRWDTDKREEKALRHRQRVSEAYIRGMPLPEILDRIPAEYQCKPVIGDPSRGSLVFTESNDYELIPRPLDGLILYKDRGTDEAICITYDHDYLTEDTMRYHGFGGF